eukprot:1142796-Pelagomonas_calceolata.AAC.1
MPTLSDPKAQCNPRPPKGVPVLVFVSFKLASFANFTTTGKLKLPHHLTTPLTTTDGPLFFPVSPHHQSCQESRGGEVGGDVEARWDPVHAPRLQANTRTSALQSCIACAFAVRFKEGVNTIPELEVMGSPEMSVVAIQARDSAKLNVYKLNDLMEKVGWGATVCCLGHCKAQCVQAERPDGEGGVPLCAA